MLVPLSWLKEYLDIPSDLTPHKLAEALTLAGLEVDKVEASSLGFTGVIVGKVLKAEPHPQAERLRIATVSDGKSTYQVVCGAPNCRAGIVTAFAMIGAHLTDDNGETFKIKKSKLRGIDSEGMLCTEKELGLNDHHEGIAEFAETFPLGKSLLELFGDTVFEISLTPNLGHCMSIRGIARELSSLLHLKLHLPKDTLNTQQGLLTSDQIGVSIESPDQCLRYACHYMEHIEVKASPEWLVKRLEACGMRSVNNVVDVTNYVLLEYGQPLHAFDYDRIEGSQIIVKSSENPTTLTTLDQVERSIPAGTLLICDEQKPLAVAGIIGGLSSAVTSHTTRVLLESAYFHPSSIRKASKELNLRTDSSSRFEKTVDPDAILTALNRAAYLLQEVASGLSAEDVLDEASHPFVPRVITCRLSRINSLLGTQLSLSEVETILHRLRIPCITNTPKELFELKIPSYRNDIKEEIDLVEEVARIYGYNNIDLKPIKCINSQIPHSSLYQIENQVRTRLVAEGLQEMLTCSLISPKLATLALEHSISEDPLIHVLHPSSVDQSILRPSLLPSLLQAVKHNFDHQTFTIAAFELGFVHYKTQGQFVETPVVGIIVTGAQAPRFWGSKEVQADVFDLKGIIENLLQSLGVPAAEYGTLGIKGFHPGRQALISRAHHTLGLMGEIHPSILAKLDIQQKVYFAQLDLRELLNSSQKTHLMKPLPLYPGSERDWTATFKEETPYETILTTLRSISSRLVKDLTLIDLYRSDKLGSDRKNITLRFLYRDDQKTIAFETADKEHARILSLAQQKLKSYLV
jgi:phenylalanyl-tRNA synthetase beta chain